MRFKLLVDGSIVRFHQLLEWFACAGENALFQFFLIPQECIHLVQGSPDTSTIQWRGVGVGHLQITLAIGRQ